jgi:hypothetical protein
MWSRQVIGQGGLQKAFKKVKKSFKNANKRRGSRMLQEMKFRISQRLGFRVWDLGFRV